jgi:hypothetical protein
MPKVVEKEGKVTTANKRYYVTIGRTRKEIPIGEAIAAGDIRKLVGKTVPVLVAGSSIVRIGKGPGIICYIPAPNLASQIRPDVRQFLTQKYRQLGLLPAE